MCGNKKQVVKISISVKKLGKSTDTHTITLLQKKKKKELLARAGELK